MKQKHTPGPWSAPSAGIWTADGKCLIAELGSRAVVKSRRAYARKYYGDDATHNPAEMALSLADAKLIAAAPALLAACEAIIEAGTQRRQNIPEHLCPGWTLVWEAVEQARGTITDRRVTGENDR